jgi:hypothetical protein
MTTTIPIDAHRGWLIYTLDAYDTPYYYAAARRINGRLVEGPAQHVRSVAAVKRRIDKHLGRVEAAS